MSWTVLKNRNKHTVCLTKKTPFGELSCRVYHTNRPDSYMFDASTEIGFYCLSLGTEDDLSRHLPSVEVVVLFPSLDFLASSKEECLARLKPYIDEITGGLPLERHDEVPDENEYDCGCCPCCGCTCDENDWDEYEDN